MIYAYAEIINGDQNMGACEEEFLGEALAKGWHDGPFEVAIAIRANDADEPMEVVGMCDAGGQIWINGEMVGHAEDYLFNDGRINGKHADEDGE